MNVRTVMMVDGYMRCVRRRVLTYTATTPDAAHLLPTRDASGLFIGGLWGWGRGIGAALSWRDVARTPRKSSANVAYITKPTRAPKNCVRAPTSNGPITSPLRYVVGPARLPGMLHGFAGNGANILKTQIRWARDSEAGIASIQFP